MYPMKFLGVHDFDGDGLGDLAYAVQLRHYVNWQTLVWFENMNALQFRERRWNLPELNQPFSGEFDAENVSLGDMDGDGLLDVFGAMRNGEGDATDLIWQRMTENNDGGLELGSVERITMDGRILRLDAADMDSDGDLDFLLGLGAAADRD